MVNSEKKYTKDFFSSYKTNENKNFIQLGTMKVYHVPNNQFLSLAILQMCFLSLIKAFNTLLVMLLCNNI